MQAYLMINNPSLYINLIIHTYICQQLPFCLWDHEVKVFHCPKYWIDCSAKENISTIVPALVKLLLKLMCYPPIVRDVIAKVRHGRGKDGGDPQGIYAKGWEIFQGQSESWASHMLSHFYTSKELASFYVQTRPARSPYPSPSESLRDRGYTWK